MKVKYFARIENHYGNLIWDGKFHLTSKKHPFADCPKLLVWPGEQHNGDDRLSKFREAGYYASCFPEGDGICFNPLKGQSEEQVRHDIQTILQLEII